MPEGVELKLTSEVLRKKHESRPPAAGAENDGPVAVVPEPVVGVGAVPVTPAGTLTTHTIGKIPVSSLKA
jgi:hypothetical protein